jgi:hypothetical protein
VIVLPTPENVKRHTTGQQRPIFNCSLQLRLTVDSGTPRHPARSSTVHCPPSSLAGGVAFVPIIVKLKNLLPEPIQSDRVSHWNLTVPKGWKMYESLLNQIAQKKDKIVEDEYLDIEDVKKKTDTPTD